MSVRVRFAPSPTGYLHIGGARTALFNWLFARHHGGTFLLRIEDTDSARNTEEAVEVILSGLKWLGLDWDEGPVSGADKKASKGDFGPYFQSQRAEIYQEKVEFLLEKGFAYRSEGAIKFRFSTDPVLIPDLVVGDVLRHLPDREAADPDFVIVRSDGQPVFHLVNVVDDLTMNVSHVIRGEDHLSNTAKHIALFRAFGAEPPKFAHIPLILNQDGSKMSKRDQGASLTGYDEEGYCAAGVLNYLCLLGWSPKSEEEIFTLDELVERFDLSGIGRNNARFDLQKLTYFNESHVKKMSPDSFRDFCSKPFARAGVDLNGFSTEYVQAAFESCRDKIKRAGDMVDLAGFFFRPEVELGSILTEHPAKPEHLEWLTGVSERLEGMGEGFDAATIQSELKEVAKGLGIKMGVLGSMVRHMVTGQAAGPGLFVLLSLLGRTEVLRRLARAREAIREKL